MGIAPDHPPEGGRLSRATLEVGLTPSHPSLGFKRPPVRGCTNRPLGMAR